MYTWYTLYLYTTVPGFLIILGRLRASIVNRVLVQSVADHVLSPLVCRGYSTHVGLGTCVYRTMRSFTFIVREQSK